MSFITENIVITENFEKAISDYFDNNRHDKIFLLTETNVFEYCFNYLKNFFPDKKHILIIEAGEHSKNINSLTKIWDFLIENSADKKSLIVNFGGGMICDLGAFAASTFKRGIEFINIPTSLLAQTDASVGGKNGINYNGLKNEIGTVNLPENVFIFTGFLKTLPKEQFLSGFAEMIKHGFIADKKYLDSLFAFISQQIVDYEKLVKLVEISVKIKSKVAEKDLNEKDLRKILNFGHTFGHAIESFYNESGKYITHGKAVAQGMVLELFLSHKKLNFSLTELLTYTQKIIETFGAVKISKNDLRNIINFMLHDKKNEFGKIKAVLLKNIEEPLTDQEISNEDIIEAFNFYLQLSK